MILSKLLKKTRLGQPLSWRQAAVRPTLCALPLLDTNHQRAALLVLLLGVGLVIALTPYATGLIGIPVLYASLSPVHEWLSMRVRPKLAALLVVGLALFLVVVPGVSFAGVIVAQAQQIAGSVVRNPILGRIAQLEIGGVDLGPRIAELGARVVSWMGARAFGGMGERPRLGPGGDRAHCREPAGGRRHPHVGRAIRGERRLRAATDRVPAVGQHPPAHHAARRARRRPAGAVVLLRAGQDVSGRVSQLTGPLFTAVRLCDSSLQLPRPPIADSRPASAHRAGPPLRRRTPRTSAGAAGSRDPSPRPVR